VITYLSETGQAYFSGGNITYGIPYDSGSGKLVTLITHTFRSAGSLVGLGPAAPKNVIWRPVDIPYYKTGGEWKRVKGVWIKNNNQWQKVWPPTGTISQATPGIVYRFTVPNGVFSLSLHMIGGGGGGSGAESNEEPMNTGGGGGSGYLVDTTLDVVPDQVLTYYVGRGGEGGGVGSNGSSGETTYFGSATASGGGGGAASGGGGGGTNPGSNGIYISDEYSGGYVAGGAAVEGYAAGGTGGYYNEDGEYGVGGSAGTSGFIRISW
jgi:hypothetical protein